MCIHLWAKTFVLVHFSPYLLLILQKCGLFLANFSQHHRGETVFQNFPNIQNINQLIMIIIQIQLGVKANPRIIGTREDSPQRYQRHGECLKMCSASKDLMASRKLERLTPSCSINSFSVGIKSPDLRFCLMMSDLILSCKTRLASFYLFFHFCSSFSNLFSEFVIQLSFSLIDIRHHTSYLYLCKQKLAVILNSVI